MPAARAARQMRAVLASTRPLRRPIALAEPAKVASAVANPRSSVGSDPSATDTPRIPLAARCHISRGCRQSDGDDEAERPKVGHQLAHPRLRQVRAAGRAPRRSVGLRLPGQPAALLHERFAPAHGGECRVQHRPRPAPARGRRANRARTARPASGSIRRAVPAGNRRCPAGPGRWRVGRPRPNACAGSGSVGTQVAAAPAACRQQAVAVATGCQPHRRHPGLQRLGMVTPSSPASRSRPIVRTRIAAPPGIVPHKRAVASAASSSP